MRKTFKLNEVRAAIPKEIKAQMHEYLLTRECIKQMHAIYKVMYANKYDINMLGTRLQKYKDVVDLIKREIYFPLLSIKGVTKFHSIHWWHLKIELIKEERKWNSISKKSNSNVNNH